MVLQDQFLCSAEESVFFFPEFEPSMCLSVKYVQISYVIAVLPLFKFLYFPFLGGSFQKSRASNYGERSSAWASCRAQQNTGTLS